MAKFIINLYYQIKKHYNKLWNISCEGMIESILVICIGVIMLLGIGIQSLKFFIAKTRIMQSREVFLFKCRHFTPNIINNSSIQPQQYNQYKPPQTKGFLAQARNLSSNSNAQLKQEAPYVYTHNNNFTEVLHPDQIAITYLENKKCIRGNICIQVLYSQNRIEYYYNDKLMYSESTQSFLHEMMKIPLNENKKFNDINKIITLS